MNQTHVDNTQIHQEMLVGDVTALVCRACSAHRQTVTLSVYSIRTVQVTRLAKVKSVSTHALAYVVLMLIAKSEIIFLSVSVTEVTLVTHFHSVDLLQVRDI